MGVIAVLATLTLVSVRGISRDARLASAVNTVTAALDNARAAAMRRNTLALVVFRPRLVGEKEQVVEVVTADWGGESYGVDDDGNGIPEHVVDRFVPLPDVPVRALPSGIKVAAPRYADGRDEEWVTQSHLPATRLASNPEQPGRLIGVMYGPDGTTLTANSRSDSTRTWVDFASSEMDQSYPWVHDGPSPGDGFSPTEAAVVGYVEQRYPLDEPVVTFAPFLAVYDDDAARERKTLDWSTSANYESELTGSLGYISNYADRIHFNRYTGVVMR
jgi:hypothetical protein